ncbi:MAG: mannose-phosphate guanylyltransferase/mannose-6-phosphate isomerase [Rhodocyclaceae bacterium]|nr:mannose-phosphate guanylyltransferase/mannose-6-phosphate isomerase [Rhodocyclaceae bacterium]
MRIQPVILCGGSGTRLWPLSREQYPKQLLKLCGERTMLQATALRLAGMHLAAGDALAPPLLVGNEEYRFLMAQQIQETGLPRAMFILEPCGRNTAPALTLATLAAIDDGQDPVLVIMPADHVIQDEGAFCQAVAKAAPLANGGRLVTFGIQPTAPETGYGYIKQGAALEEGSCQVELFVEKPDLATAEAYLASGQYLWNSGIFVIKASTWLTTLERCRPDIAAACLKAFEGSQRDREFLRPDKAAFAACPADSIDYAVMEPLTQPGANTGEVAVLPLDARWSDVGAWSALWEIGDKDADQNVLMGDIITVDTHNTLVLGNGRLVACVGLDNTIVVETPDAILVADKDQIQKVKDLVGHLKERRRSESYSHRKVFRPWGSYDSIDFGNRFQVKRIIVTPGACLSLQMHYHRAEHWIVVSGTAKVTRGEETFLVSENQSTYIPLGTVHRLENPGKLPLEMIEVQSGSYLGEDDIIRFEDQYGR